MSAPIKSKVMVLRHDVKLVRDCWIDIDTTNPNKKVLVIRQIKFTEDGQESNTQTKQFRLTEEEVNIIFKLFADSKI